jgi:signal peptidase I
VSTESEGHTLTSREEFAVELESAAPAAAPGAPTLEELAPALPAERSATAETSAAQLLSVDPSVVDARSKRARRRRGWMLAQLACLGMMAYVALFHVSVVRGSSMAPGIHDGDRIVVDHFAYLFQPVGRGDVVVLKYPLDPSLDYIKRIIGLPGDEVVIENGSVWVNGKALSEPYVASADPLTRTHVRVQPAHYFVLGDNRPRSSDSREFGQVPMDYVRGRVEVRLWPPSRIGTVH